MPCGFTRVSFQFEYKVPVLFILSLFFHFVLIAPFYLLVSGPIWFRDFRKHKKSKRKTDVLSVFHLCHLCFNTFPVISGVCKQEVGIRGCLAHHPDCTWLYFQSFCGDSGDVSVHLVADAAFLFSSWDIAILIIFSCCLLLGNSSIVIFTSGTKRESFSLTAVVMRSL